MSNMRFVFALVVLLLGFVADVVDASAPEFCQCVTCRKRGVEPASLCVAAQLLCVDYLLGGIYESDVDCGACCERLYAASKEVNPDDGSSTIQKYCAMLSYEDIKQELDDETAATQGDAPPPPPPPSSSSSSSSNSKGDRGGDAPDDQIVLQGPPVKELHYRSADPAKCVH